MKSSVKAMIEDGQLFMGMNEAIDKLRAKIWITIFKEKGELSDCDVAMALGIVQYELIHHTKGDD